MRSSMRWSLGAWSRASWCSLVLAAGTSVTIGDDTWRLHVGPGGARYTPFEWLSDEDEVTTTQAAGGAPQAGPPHAHRSVQRAKFRIRTETMHPHPSVADALHAYRPMRPDEGAAGKAIRARLRARCERLDFEETPLNDVVVHLREALGIPVRLDLRALDEAGLDPHAPITAAVQDVSLGAALRTILGGLDMAYVVRDEQLVLTTRDGAEQVLSLASYPIPLTDDGASLARLITATVAPETWGAVGGPGMIELDTCATRLAVSQTERVHEQVADLLAAMHGIHADDAADGERTPPLAHTVYVVPQPAVREHLVEHLVGVCNDALGEAGDEAAAVTTADDRVIVQSEVFAFQCYAAQVVRSLVGIEVSTVEKVTVESGGMAW